MQLVTSAVRLRHVGTFRMEHIKDNWNQGFRVYSIWHIYCWLSVAIIPRLCESAQERFILSSNTGCACLGDILTYRCTTVGLGSTVWRGTAFQCAGSSITLRHSQFSAPGGVTRDCNHGDITASSISFINNCYTSQLNVVVSGNLNNRSVTCTYDFGTGLKTIATSTLNVVQAPFLPPSNIRLADVQDEMLIFSWDSLGPMCESVNYGILSSCGTCPNKTNLTQVACSDLNLSTVPRECTFMIRTELCGDKIGNPSNPVVVTLKLPDVPDVIQVTPVYSNLNQTLIRIYAVINQTVPYNIVDGIPGSVTSYNISLSSGSQKLFRSTFTPSCVDGQCEKLINIPQCTLQADVGVTFLATNKLGTGSISDARYIGCNNDFVEVTEYNSATSTITCVFLRRLDSVKSIKSCHVLYGECQKLMFTSYGNSTGNSVTLNVQLSGSGKVYCYIVTASNGTHTVMVEDRISIASGGQDLSVAGIVGIAVMVVVVVSTIGITVLSILIFYLCRCGQFSRFYKKTNTRRLLVELVDPVDDGAVDNQKESPEPVAEPIENFVLESDGDTVFVDKKNIAEELSLESLKNLKQVHLDITVLKTEKPTEVSAFLMDQTYPAHFCCAYEFVRKEDISEEEILIFYSEEKYTCFYADVSTLCDNNLFGKAVSPPSIKGYAVFIQSTRPESRFLRKGRVLVYKEPLKERSAEQHSSPRQRPLVSESLPKVNKHFEQVPPRQLQHPMICVDASKFAMRRVTSDCTLKELCKKCDPSADIHSVFLEHDSCVGCQNLLDVMLVDKDTHMIYTGTSAMNVARKHIESADTNHWRIFVFVEPEETFQMKKGMYILYPKEQQIKVSPGQPKSPLLYIDKGSFDVKPKPSESCTIAQFRHNHNLEAGEHNIFIRVEKLDEESKTRDILDVILEDKATGEFYTCRAAWDVVKWYAHKSPDTKKWRVFVMKYFEDRLLVTTQILYWIRTKEHLSNNLLQIYSDHFAKQTLQKDLVDIRATLPTKSPVFVELQEEQDPHHIIDIILVEKGSKILYSGPYAHMMVKEHLKGIKTIDCNRWQVFVYYRNIPRLLKTTTVLYQNTQTEDGQYQILEVNEDGIQMSIFIQQYFKAYEDSRAYCEFRQEDLISYKEIVCVPSEIFDRDDKVSCVLMLQSSISLFYAIKGTPGWGLVPQNIGQEKIFVQSTLQGSRRLKKGAHLLYKVGKKDVLPDHHKIIQPATDTH